MSGKPTPGRIFAVTVSQETTAMVQADSAIEAIDKARRNAREILGECTQDVVVDVRAEITAQSQLTKHGWDGWCLPYGGDGKARLSEILAAAVEQSNG